MFSKTCKYAIRAILYLASMGEVKSRFRAEEIAAALEVPLPFLAKVLQLMVRKKLISSVKGPGGGFFVSPGQMAINLERVIEVIDGPEVFTTCVLGLPECSHENPCPLHVQAFSFREGLRYQLAHHTVEQIARQLKLENTRI